MENKTKRLVLRSRKVEAVQWNDPENPPKGVKCLREGCKIIGEFYASNSIWKRININDWIVYVHQIGRHSPVMLSFNTNQLEKEYIEVG